MSAKAVALAVVFCAAAVGGVVLHLGLRAPRAFVVSQVNAALDGVFAGKIVLLRAGAIHFGRLSGVDAEVFDPGGHRVLLVQGASALFGPVALIRSVVGGGRLIIPITAVSVDYAEVVIEDDAAGDIGLVRAFESATSDDGSPSRGVEVTIRDVRSRHAWVHGHLGAVPVIDADLDDLVGAFASTPETTDIDVVHLAITGRGIPGSSPVGTLSAHASLPGDPDASRSVVARYDGLVGQIPIRADAALEGKQVDAVVDVPMASAAAIEALAPGSIHLGAPIDLHAEVHGAWPHLEPELEAHVGEGTVYASAVVLLPDADRKELDASLSLRVLNLDAHLLEASAPATRLSATLDANVASHPGGALAGRFRLSTEAGVVAGQVVPAIATVGELTEASIRGTAAIAERGAPTHATFDLHPKQNRKTPTELDFHTDTEVADLRSIARIGPLGRGEAHVTTGGRIDLETNRMDASVRIDASVLSIQGVRIGRLSTTGKVSGPLTRPEFEASVDAAPIAFGGMVFVGGTVGVRGSPNAMEVTAALFGDGHSPTLEARGLLSTTPGIGVRAITAKVRRGSVEATIAVASVIAAGGEVDVRGIQVDGLGSPLRASVHIASGAMSAIAHADDLDLAKLAFLAGRDEPIEGHLALDVNAEARGASADGYVRLRVSELDAMDVRGATASVAVELHGKSVRASANLSSDTEGSLELTTGDITLDGPFTSASTWKRASGSAELRGNLDIGKLFERLPAKDRPISFASGNLAFHIAATRARRSGDPDIDVTLSTRGFRAVGPVALVTHEDGSMSLGPEPWRVASIDADVGAKLVGASGHAAVTAKLHDAKGPLVDGVAEADLPFDALIVHPEQATQLVLDLPLSVSVNLPKRSIDSLPEELGDLPVRGDVELTAHWEGTVKAPRFAGAAKVSHLQPKKTATCGHDIEAETKLSYDGHAAAVELDASSDGRHVFATHVDGTFDLAAALRGEKTDWEAKGKSTMSRVPLDVVGAFLDQPLGGAMSGDVEVDGLHHEATLHGTLALDGFTFGKGRFPKGTAVVDAKKGSFSATARLEQTDGFAQLSATGALGWGAEVMPTLDLTRPIELGLTAKNFRASIAKPFVEGTLSEIDGRVDANLKLHVGVGGKDGTADGAIALRDGIVDVPTIGERFHGIRGKLVMKPWGTFRLDDFVAEAPTGKLTASAQAVFAGLAFRSASGRVDIEQGQSIPISIEGVPMGRAYGRITAKAEMAANQKKLDIHVAVPLLRVDLPQSTGHSVQGLDDDKHVSIGVGGARGFEAVALRAPAEPRSPSDLTVRADIKLGKEVEVRRDTALQVFAQGETIIEISDRARVSGQIRLLRGKLELQGRMFTIDRGVISFVGKDPANPMILATAHWDSSGGIRVIADFSGFASSGKLELHSEPALSQDEILALVLFGTADGSFGAQAPPGQGESQAIQGVGLAGGVVTQGLNKVISGVTTADISTRIDSSEANNPRPEVGVQITKTISARLGYKLGVPAPGDNPDRAQLTLEWRFVRNWSLSTEVGDQGSTAVDVVWRRRY